MAIDVHGVCGGSSVDDPDTAFDKRATNGRKAGLDESMGTIPTRAYCDPSFTMICLGFFNCGYQLAFVTAHFPSFYDGNERPYSGGYLYRTHHNCRSIYYDPGDPC